MNIMALGHKKKKKKRCSENLSKDLCKIASGWLSIKSWLILDDPLWSAISASSDPIAGRCSLSLVELPGSESLIVCWDSITWAFAKAERSAQKPPSQSWSAELLNMVLQTGLSGLSISTSMGVHTGFLELKLRQGWSFVLVVCAATQVVLEGWGPGELGLLDFCPLEHCVGAVLLLLHVSTASSVSPADLQSIKFWEDTSSCVLSVCALYPVASDVCGSKQSSSLSSVRLVFGASFFTSSWLTSAFKLLQKRKKIKHKIYFYHNHTFSINIFFN